MYEEFIDVMEASSPKTSKIAITELYSTVETALKKPENAKMFRTIIDKNMARNASIYSAPGPMKRPIFTNAEQTQMYETLGLTEAKLKEVLGKLKKSDSRWGIQGVNYPFMLANVLSIRHWTINQDKKQLQNALSYFIVFQYPLLHYKYFRYEPTESVMLYVVNNLSNKFRLKQNGNLWNTLVEIVMGAYELHKPRIKNGDDDGLVRFLTDARTRMNSFMRKIGNEFYEAHNSGVYLQSEADNFEEDKYYEADSNTLLVARITTKTLSRLVINGPDMKLVELAAKNCDVSVNQLRNCTQSMCNGDHQEDIRQILESLLNIYLVTGNRERKGKRKTGTDVGTNDFLIYSMNVYKKSNTVDPDVIRIKEILDRWMEESDIRKRIGSPTQIGAFRRALYMFFVLTLVKEN